VPSVEGPPKLLTILIGSKVTLRVHGEALSTGYGTFIRALDLSS